MKFWHWILLIIFSWGINVVPWAQCPAGEWPLEINIIPDSYPNETTWNLSLGNQLLASGNYLSDTLCVDSSGCMRFDIFDSYGDGICCGYGLGSYTLILNGDTAAIGGQFASSATHFFNCSPGTICTNPLTAQLGNYTTAQNNSYYTFTPDSTGNYAISTCNLTSCDTKIWIYSSCLSVPNNNTNSGAILHNDNNPLCGVQAHIEGLLTAGTTYLVRVGYGDNFSNSQAFNYTGNVQYFIAPITGTYLLKAWGAQGGNLYQLLGAKGGYATGSVVLNQGDTLGIYIGGKGVDNSTASGGGWNGGGNAGDQGLSGGGGGASDIRWGGNDLNHRILVAGGGGGAGCCGTIPGEGGGLNGINGSGLGGTQSTGGAGAGPGDFGLGGHKSGDGGGGGGGWYGGGAAFGAEGGGGGSSYVGGVLNGTTFAGNDTLPNPNGGVMVGNVGDGHIKISWIDSACMGQIPFSIQYLGGMNSVLPIVVLNTVNNAINDNSKVEVSMKIIDNGPNALNFANDTAFAFEGATFTKWLAVTGNNFPKKNFEFSLVDSIGNAMDTSLLGLPKGQDWIFDAAYSDNSLLKNDLMYALARKIGVYAPRTKHVEMFLDGDYQGVYTLTEKINPTQERLNIQPLGYSDTLGNELSGGYILEMNINNDPGAWNSTYPPITQATCPHPVQFKHVYPAPDTIHPVQSNYIHAYVDSFENALNGVSYLSDSLSYRRWIDVGSFIDFLLLNEVSMNYQSYGLNTYMYKNVDSIQGKLCIGPPWRFDQAMNSNPPTGWVWETTNPGWPYPFWWSRFFTDSSFRSELACRWLSLRSSVLSNSAFMMCADSLSNLLLQGPSERNFATWPTLNGISYPQHLLNTKVFLFNRLSWMDQALSAYGAVLPSLIIPQDTTVCKGITYTAPYHPEYVYNWTPGPETPEITFTTPGNYVLEVRDSSGCERNLPMHVGVSEPDTTFTQLNSDIQYTFTGNNGISSQYLWDFGDQTLWGNGLQAVHVYAVPGIYTVQMTVTDTLGCIGKSAQTLQITQGSLQVGIHPNPFQNDPTVVHNLPLDGTFTFMLYDAAGRKLKEYASPASPFTLETHGMAHGTYLLKCAFEGKTIAQSLIRL